MFMSGERNGSRTENDRRTLTQDMALVRRIALSGLLVWLVLISSSLAWNLHHMRSITHKLVKNTAIANFNKDQAFRAWATEHGGIYVPSNERTPPNPYLYHIPERDIATPSGQPLTLMNPAYMLRQVVDEFSELYGIKGRITSLDPLRPSNTPDEWERSALLSFEAGSRESFEFSTIEGEAYFRLMRPMMTVEGCLKCHAHQGYVVGQVRGGVSISVPLAPYYALESNTITYLILTHGLIFLVGLVGLFVAFQMLVRWIERNHEQREKLHDTLERQASIISEAVQTTRQQEQVIADQNRQQAMNRLLVDLAHHWRQPLNVAAMCMQELEELEQMGLLTKEVMSERIEQALVEIFRLSETITQFTDFYGSQQSSREDYGLRSLCEQAFKLASSGRAPLPELRCHIDPDLHVNVYRKDVVEIFIVLFRNILDAMQQRGLSEAHVLVRAELDPASGNLSVSVADNAGGIDNELLPRIFEPYVTTAFKSRHKGMGLYLCRRIVEDRYSGDMGVENSDQGACFHFTLKHVQVWGAGS